MLPLADIRVLDFSTLLPGPLASLFLAEAGAEVIKVERAGTGEDMRGYSPQINGTGASFGLLNRGKRSLAVDLKNPGVKAELLEFAKTTDVVIEQFRPGVMSKLGLGYADFQAVNPKIIYCSITGYGQSGANAHIAGHDLTYAADSGLLSLVTSNGGMPAMPSTLTADIGGGAMPAVINILLALRNRDQTGKGCQIDISMTDNLFMFAFWGLASGFVAGNWPKADAELLTGGSPRYAIHVASDGRFVAAAPLEEKFWKTFCEVIKLPEELRDDKKDAEATLKGVAACIAQHPSSYWEEAFSKVDVCCRVIKTLEEAAHAPYAVSKGLFDRRVAIGTQEIPALPLPLAPSLRRTDKNLSAPAVGEGNRLLRSD